MPFELAASTTSLLVHSPLLPFGVLQEIHLHNFPSMNPSDRQQTNAVAEGIHRNQRASLEVRFSGTNCAYHDVADGGGQNVLAAHLNHAGSFGP